MFWTGGKKIPGDFKIVRVGGRNCGQIYKIRLNRDKPITKNIKFTVFTFITGVGFHTKSVINLIFWNTIPSKSVPVITKSVEICINRIDNTKSSLAIEPLIQLDLVLSHGLNHSLIDSCKHSKTFSAKLRSQYLPFNMGSSNFNKLFSNATVLNITEYCF